MFLQIVCVLYELQCKNVMAEYYLNRKAKKTKKFSDDMKLDLKNMYKEHSNEQLAEYFGVSVIRIKTQMQRQMLTRRNFKN